MRSIADDPLGELVKSGYALMFNPLLGAPQHRAIDDGGAVASARELR
jgi:hypothetical protein